MCFHYSAILPKFCSNSEIVSEPESQLKSELESLARYLGILAIRTVNRYYYQLTRGVKRRRKRKSKNDQKQKNQKTKWSIDEISPLIDLYEGRPCLWDVFYTSEHHKKTEEPIPSRDVSLRFCSFVAEKLAGFDAKTRAIAEKRIADLLFELECVPNVSAGTPGITLFNKSSTFDYSGSSIAPISPLYAWAQYQIS